MVPEISAKLLLPHEESLECYADHSQIAKLTRSQSGVCGEVRATILKAAGRIAGSAVASTYDTNVPLPEPSPQKDLCSAVQQGDYEKVKSLLARGCRAHSSQNEEVDIAEDPFLLAAQCLQARILDLLFEYGANPYERTLGGDTALHVLACPKSEDSWLAESTIQLLPRQQALLEARNRKGETPLLKYLRRDPTLNRWDTGII